MMRLFTIAFVLLFPLVSSAAVIQVPANQPTIQAGIDAAASGDTVLVAPMQTLHGAWYLEAPILTLQLGPTPGTGVYSIHARVPPAIPAPDSIPLQGLIQAQLTNLCTIDVPSP